MLRALTSSLVVVFFSVCTVHAKPHFCAAIRGNGHYMPHHFGALAKIVEEYGYIDGMAGGSSASITTFIYESIAVNPQLVNRTPSEKALKISLLLKSFLGYQDFMKNGPRMSVIQELHGLKVAMSHLRFSELSSGDLQLPDDIIKKIQDISQIFKDPEVVKLINPKFLELLSPINQNNYKSYAYQIAELLKAIENLDKYDASDERVLFREGPLSFAGFADKIGQMGNFYAGYDDISQVFLSEFIEGCSQNSKGKTWDEIQKLHVKNQSNTCGEVFNKALRQFSWKDETMLSQNRLDEPIGKYILTIPITSILTGDSLKQFAKAMQQYRADEELTDFRPDFSDVYFSYFIPRRFHGKVLANLRAQDANDEKLNKFALFKKVSLSVEDFTWSSALRVSPLEPGLGKISYAEELVDLSRLSLANSQLKERELNSYSELGFASRRITMETLDGEKTLPAAFIGGWSDLHPVQVLQAAGCENIIYITREGGTSAFVSAGGEATEQGKATKSGIAELLGLDDVLSNKLFAAENPESSFNRAKNMASAIWCTNWDMVGNASPREMFQHSYDSPIVLQDEESLFARTQESMVNQKPSCDNEWHDL